MIICLIYDMSVLQEAMFNVHSTNNSLLIMNKILKSMILPIYY